jgi:hypothetical protein
MYVGGRAGVLLMQSLRPWSKSVHSSVQGHAEIVWALDRPTATVVVCSGLAVTVHYANS